MNKAFPYGDGKPFYSNQPSTIYVICQRVNALFQGRQFTVRAADLALPPKNVHLSDLLLVLQEESRIKLGHPFIRAPADLAPNITTGAKKTASDSDIWKQTHLSNPPEKQTMHNSIHSKNVPVFHLFWCNESMFCIFCAKVC